MGKEEDARAAGRGGSLPVSYDNGEASVSYVKMTGKEERKEGRVRGRNRPLANRRDRPRR